MKRTKIIRWGIMLGTLLFLFYSGIIWAEQVPDGPTNLTVLNSTRKTAAPSITDSALAGNISHIVLTGESVTQTWQGYVGNVSGYITLSNADNATLYDWQVTNPGGEIYVANQAVDFSFGRIECYNMSEYHIGTHFILSEFEAWLGVNENSSDGVNETFNATTDFTNFYAGTNSISGECPLLNLYNSSGEKTDGVFEEVLLYDNVSQVVIYTAILDEQPHLGYDGNYWDFQMIVGENGHDGNTDPTTYYFYVELE